MRSTRATDASIPSIETRPASSAAGNPAAYAPETMSTSTPAPNASAAASIGSAATPCTTSSRTPS